jgi:hypothetical protein
MPTTGGRSRSSECRTLVKSDLEDYSSAAAKRLIDTKWPAGERYLLSKGFAQPQKERPQ